MAIEIDIGRKRSSAMNSGAIEMAIGPAYTIITECPVNETVYLTGELYDENYMHQGDYKGKTIQYGIVRMRDHDYTEKMFGNIIEFENKVIIEAELDENNDPTGYYMFKIEIVPEMFQYAYRTFGSVRWFFDDDLYGFTNINLYNGLKPLVIYRNKIDMHPNDIPLWMHLNQHETNFRLCFELYSSKGTLEIESDKPLSNWGRDFYYRAELRGQRPDGTKFILSGNIEYIRTLGPTGSSSDMVIHYYAVFIGIPELTEQCGEIPFEILLRRVSNKNSSKAQFTERPNYTGEELRSTNGAFIIESKP